MDQGRKTPLLLKSLCLAALVIVLALAGYWVKCQLGVNIFPGYSWEKHFPFLNSFQKIERVIRPAAGKVFAATFDELLPRYYWRAEREGRREGDEGVSSAREGLRSVFDRKDVEFR